MNELVQLFVFTALPGLALAVGIGYSLYEISRIGERRLAIITVILGFMLLHQGIELSKFVTTGGFPSAVFGELLETAANATAAGSVYYVLRFTRQERRLREQADSAKARVDSLNDRLELIFDNVNDGILLVDVEQDEIIEANSSICEMLRYSKDELRGRSPYDLHPHEPEQFEALTNALRADGGVRSDQLSCRRQDGSTMPAAVSASRATLDGSTVMLITIRDNTEQKQYRTQADLLSRVLRHNLRNDMTVVMGQLEVIKSRSDNPESKQSTATAIDKCAELLEVSEQTRKLNEILDIERRRITHRTDIIPLARDALEQIEQEYPEAQLVSDLPETAPVQASEDIAWAIENIVENAIVHTDEEEPRVEISLDRERVRRDGFQTDWYTVTVSDYGPGIPADEVNVLNDDEARTPTEHGSGLGLWITRQIVEIFDGEVDIDRSPDSEHSTSVRLRLLPADGPTS
jgi:PAS domain S-box-containing protein